MPPKPSAYPFVWLTLHQCALRTNLPSWVISKAINSGELPTAHLGSGRFLVHPRDLGAYVEMFHR